MRPKLSRCISSTRRAWGGVRDDLVILPDVCMSASDLSTRDFMPRGFKVGGLVNARAQSFRDVSAREHDTKELTGSFHGQFWP